MNGPSFRFRLERVRNLRERREERAKHDLAAAMAQHRRGEQAVRRAEQRVESAQDAQRNTAAGTTSANDLIALQAYLERTEQARTASHDDLAQRAVELADRRDDLTTAARERQALERLKEHRREEHRREVERLEGQALDEIAINNFRRNAA
jgi:flagellar protein FliJ